MIDDVDRVTYRAKGQDYRLALLLRRMRSLVTLEHREAAAHVLVVTSGWPDEDDPAHCVFIQRQMDSLRMHGVRYDTLLIHAYRSKLAYLVAFARLAAANFSGRKYRLVHAHGGEAALPALMYRRAPLLVSYLGGDLLGNSYRADARVPVSGRMRRTLIKQSARFTRATITKSREMEAVLPKDVQHRNSVIPNGVDSKHFCPTDKAEARRRLGWEADESVVLFVGDPCELRKRFTLAHAAVESAKLTLARIRLAVAHRVEPDMVPTYLNAADCLVHLSWMEGSPNVVKEALMCNLPVIATPVGDVADLLEGVEAFVRRSARPR